MIIDDDKVYSNYCTRLTGFTTRLAFEAAAEAYLGRNSLIIVGSFQMMEYISDKIRCVFYPHIHQLALREIKLFNSGYVTFVTINRGDSYTMRGRTFHSVLVDNSVSRIPDEIRSNLRLQ